MEKTTTMIKRKQQQKEDMEILQTLESIFFGFPSELSQTEFEGILTILEELQYYMRTEFDYVPGEYVIVSESPAGQTFHF